MFRADRKFQIVDIVLRLADRDQLGVETPSVNNGCRARGSRVSRFGRGYSVFDALRRNPTESALLFKANSG